MTSPSPKPDAFLVKQHILFAFRSLKFLPSQYESEDNNRMALAYFCLSALALLPGDAVSSLGEGGSALDAMLKPKQKTGFIDWVYEQQLPSGGFRGSDSLEGAAPPFVVPPADSMIPLSAQEEEEFDRLMAFPDDEDDEDDAPAASTSSASESPYDPANLIQCYTAILLLGLLGDDYARLNRQGLLRFIARCQNSDGSFVQFPGHEEPADPRSTYAAFAVCSMLDDWSAVDVDAALRFLRTCHRHEGGYSTRPGLEAHGGATYVSIASFALANRLYEAPNPQSTIRWLVDRQVRPPPPPEPSSDSDEDSATEDGEAPEMKEDMAGFQGRPNKVTDACYSFWCTAALRILSPDVDLLQPELDRRWLHSCQHKLYGGIAREPGAPPDVYHTYLSLAALSIGGQPGLRPLDPAWNVAVDVAANIKASLKGRTAVGVNP